MFFAGGGIPATAPTVIFRNMAIHNGKAQGGNGGGIGGNGGNYTTPACAGGAGGWGGGACGSINYDGITEYGGSGGLFARSGTLTLKNILFDRNSAIRGTGETNG